MTAIQELYGRLRRLAFPNIGKVIGDFPLYDALIAGLAERASQGEFIPPSETPGPDDETLMYVAKIRGSSDIAEDERIFLEYFDLLEAIRAELSRLSL